MLFSCRATSINIIKSDFEIAAMIQYIDTFHLPYEFPKTQMSITICNKDRQKISI